MMLPAILLARCPLPAARCPLPAARCPLPAARCPLRRLVCFSVRQVSARPVRDAVTHLSAKSKAAVYNARLRARGGLRLK